MNLFYLLPFIMAETNVINSKNVTTLKKKNNDKQITDLI